MVSSRNAHLFAGYDFLIASEVQLPGSVEIPSNHSFDLSKPDIRISITPVQIPANATFRSFYACDDEIIYGFDKKIARFACHSNGNIHVDPVRKVCSELIGRLIVASAIPALLWMKRQLVMHAAAVRLPGSNGAIAFSGASGSGKSTLLQQLITVDAKVLADDNLRLTNAETCPTISGLPGAFCRSDEQTTEKSSRPYVQVSAALRCNSAPLSALIYLEPHRDSAETQITRVKGVDALQLLLLSRHRSAVVELLKREKEHLKDFVAVSRQIAVYRWARREGQIELNEKELDFLMSNVTAEIE